MPLLMDKCKKRLAIVWVTGAGVLFLVLVLQSIFGRYGDKTNDAWAWLLPTIIPTLSLIVGVVASDALDKSVRAASVDVFMYRLALSLSVAYLVVVSLTIFLGPLSDWPQLELMKLSNLWLAPLQGIVAAAIGVFFVSKGPRK